MFGPQPGDQSVILTTLGGLVTEAPSASLSEGSSPLCWDVDFLVGSVFTRPGESSVYGASIGSVNFIWLKTYQQLDGQIYTLALDASGNLWREDVTNNPGVLVACPNRPTLQPNDTPKSVTAYNREYIAFGPNDIPRQYDGTNFDRISQEGPGANANFVVTSAANPNLANVAGYTITSNVITFDATNSFSVGTIVQLAAGRSTIDQVEVLLNSGPFDGLILTITAATGTTFSATYVAANTTGTVPVSLVATPLTNFPITSITQPAAQTIYEQLLWSAAADQAGAGNTLTVYYNQTTQDATLVNAFNSGIPIYVYLSGLPSPYPDGTYRVLSIGRSVFSSNNAFYFTVSMATTLYSKTTGGSLGTYQMTLATVTMSTPIPGAVVGNSVSIQGATPSTWNGSWTIVQAPNSGIFVITQTSMDASGNVTYDYTLQTGATPVVGDLVTVTNTTNGNGLFNVVNATITAVGTGTFQIVLPGVTAAVTAQSENGQAEVSGRYFLIDPGSNFVGGTNSASPIFGNDTGTGEIVTVGQNLNIAAGTRQAVVLFLTRNGYLTRPSPPVTFTTDNNTAAIQLNNIPLGPPNVIARWVAVTEAGANGVPGAYFYTIPQPVQTIVNGQPYTYAPTVINDNVTTQATFSFVDAVLLSSLEIDITGGDNFAQVELANCGFVLNYADRMFYGLVNNKVNNFVNMSFAGGYNSGPNPFPLGWTATSGTAGSGGSLIPSTTFGNDYLISNTTGSTQVNLGLITQNAALDAYKAPILQPNTLYSVRILARIPANVSVGNLVVALTTYDTQVGYGPTLGSFSIPFTSLSTTPQWITGTLLTTAFTTVPTNLLLLLYALNIGNGANVAVSRIEIFPTNTPVLNTQLYASYVNNPEAIDGVTGVLQVNSTNTQPLFGGVVMYDQLYLLKQNSLFSTQDTPGSEPSGWAVHEVSNKVGTCGPSAYDFGEEWIVTACRTGLYVFFGKQPVKISQEIYQLWEAINWKYASTIWVKVDIVNRRILVGVPMATGSGTKSFQWLPNAPAVANPTSPNVILMLNYLGLGDITALADGPQMHTTMFGTLMSVDMRRKWAIWNITSPYADLILQNDGFTQTLYLGNGVANGKIYQLLASQLSDDGAAINGTYTTYGFVDAEKARQYPLLGSHRKQWTYAQFLAYGSGSLTLKAYMNSLTPPQASQIYTAPAITLVANPFDDYERPINAVGNRVFVQFSTNAAGAAFTLERLTMVGRVATLQIRGSAAQ